MTVRSTFVPPALGAAAEVMIGTRGQPSRLKLVHVGLADALPGLHQFAFAPAGWPEYELLGETGERRL